MMTSLKMSDPHRVSPACPICQEASAVRQFATRSPFPPAVTLYDVWLCRSCEHRWCVGDVSPALLSAVYQGEFHGSAQQSDGAAEKSPVVINARSRVRWMQSLGLSGRVLDVGAGAGFFVLAANHAGFDATGIDLSPVAASQARSRGAPVMQGDFLSGEAQTDPVDVVTLWDSLCGMTDPHACMARVSEQLAQGGSCIMTVAAGRSQVARLAGRFWPLMIPPVNLHFFSRASLERLLADHGLALTEWRAAEKRVAIGFVIQKLLRTIKLGEIGENIGRGVPPSWSLTLNLGDIVTAVAVRQETSEAVR